MTIDYIPDINAYGENVVRLYDFDSVEAERFRKALHQVVLVEKQPLDLMTLLFMKSRNANLILRISEEDEGITTKNGHEFYCDLTIAAYEKMEELITPFCHKETVAYQILTDIDEPTDLLFAPAGKWEEED